MTASAGRSATMLLRAALSLLLVLLLADHAPAASRVCRDLEAKLVAAGIEVLVDDRDDRPGAKFATMDLIGCPYQLIVGPKGVKAGEVEVKSRRGGERRTLAPDAAIQALAAEIRAARNLA